MREGIVMTETLLTDPTSVYADTGPEVTPPGEGRMVRGFERAVKSNFFPRSLLSSIGRA